MSAPRLVALLLVAFAGGVAHAATEVPAVEPAEFHLGVYLLGSSFVFIEMIDLLVRARRRRLVDTRGGPEGGAPTSIPLDIGSFSPYQRRLHLRPYAIAVSVHDLGSEVEDFLQAMAPYREVLWVIDDASSDDTRARLRAAGIRCVHSDVNRKKPGAIRALLAQIPSEVQTVLVLDPDCRIYDAPGAELSHLENVIFEFQRSGHAALCPRIEVEHGNWLARLQRFEYAMCFGLGRRSLGAFGIVSGIAMYRRDALARLLDRHSLSVYAEDVENSLRLLADGETIYYDERFLVWTRGKEEPLAWFSQRVGWSFGFLRVYEGQFRDVLRFALSDPMCAYQYLVYMGVFQLLFHPFRIAAVLILVASAASGFDCLVGTDWLPNGGVFNPWYFPLVLVKYSLFAWLAVPLVSRRGDRWEHVLTAPIYLAYAVVQVVPMTVGYVNWVSLRWFGRRVYRDHYATDDQIDGRGGRAGRASA